MHHKIVLGTANFTLPYGVLNNGAVLAAKTVADIFTYAFSHEVNTLDTAFAYGDALELIADKSYTPKLDIVTKFSLKDDLQDVEQAIRSYLTKYQIPQLYGLLVHDPQNLSSSHGAKLKDLFAGLKDSGMVQKIGVSVYSVAEAQQFSEVVTPDLIQIPLNPLNQQFNCAEFKDFVFENNIEVHARSLFLQGVLLANELPTTLQGLDPIWQDFRRIVNSFSSRLDVLMAWAFEQTWVNKWVLGVTSVEDLKAILQSSKGNVQVNDLFDELKTMFHPMTDPRNWRTA